MDVPTAEVSTKYRLVTSPRIPAQCLGCKRHHKMDAEGVPEIWLDLDMDIEFYGAALLCNYCAAEIARVLGYVSVAKVREYVEKFSGLKAELKAVEAKLQEAEENVSVLKRIIGSDSGSVASDGSSSVESDVLPTESGTTPSKKSK